MLLFLVGAAVVPSVLPFTVSTSDEERVCVPIAEGWKAEQPEPAAADMRELANALAAGLPSPEAMRDPIERAEWLRAEAARTSTPGYKRAESYVRWRDGSGACVPESRHRRDGSGACVPESRHRLILSATAVGVLAAITATVFFARRRRDDARTA